MTLLEHKQYSQSNYQPKEQLDTTQQTSSVPCSGKTKLFFSENSKDMRIAQQICLSCPNQQKCLAQARQDPPYAGVWGGVIFVDGEELLAKRGRGRPSKNEQELIEANAVVLSVLQIA